MSAIQTERKRMTDNASSSKLYEQMKRLAQTALDRCGFSSIISEMEILVYLYMDQNPPRDDWVVCDFESLIKIYDGVDGIDLYIPFNLIAEPELEYLVRISHNRRISVRVYRNHPDRAIIFSMMACIPSQLHLPDSKTINCEIEFRREKDAQGNDIAEVELVNWYDAAIDDKLVQWARVSHAFIAEG